MHKKLKPPTKGPADEKSLFHTHKHHYCLGRWLHVLNAQKYGHYMLWQSDQWHFRAGEWASVGRVLWTIMAPLLGKQASWLQSQEVDGLLKCSRRAGRAQWEGASNGNFITSTFPCFVLVSHMWSLDLSWLSCISPLTTCTHTRTHRGCVYSVHRQTVSRHHTRWRGHLAGSMLQAEHLIRR